MPFTGGKLKLKGGDVGKKKGKKKIAKEDGEGAEGALIVVEGAGGAAVVQKVCPLRQSTYLELTRAATLLGTLINVQKDKVCEPVISPSAWD